MAISLGITKIVEVQAKELRIYTKVTDRFCFSLHDQNGGEIYQQDDGYVPDFMPGEHFGDYVILNIDLETGRITNWKVPSAADLQDYVEAHGE